MNDEKVELSDVPNPISLRHDPVVLAAAEVHEAEIIAQCGRRLSTLADKAITVLEETMESKKTSRGAKLKAAQTVMNVCMRWRKTIDSDTRLQRMEKRMDGFVAEVLPNPAEDVA